MAVALLGACATLLLAGKSVNMLTMFAMVLAVGIPSTTPSSWSRTIERIMAED